MLRSKMVKMYDGYEVFKKVRDMFGEDIEGEINIIYNPPCTGAYAIYIPSREDMTEENYSACEIKLFQALLDEPDIVPEDTVWIEVDY